jgi:hypothetical protein
MEARSAWERHPLLRSSSASSRGEARCQGEDQRDEYRQLCSASDWGTISANLLACAAVALLSFVDRLVSVGGAGYQGLCAALRSLPGLAQDPFESVDVQWARISPQ